MALNGMSSNDEEIQAALIRLKRLRIASMLVVVLFIPGGTAVLYLWPESLSVYKDLALYVYVILYGIPFSNIPDDTLLWERVPEMR